MIAAEKNFENKVKKFLKENSCWVLKYWGGAAYTKSGVPDLLVCCGGVFIGIELKAPKGKPSALQIVNLRDIDRAGGYAVLLYPDQWEVFKKLIGDLQKGDYAGSIVVYHQLRLRWLEFEEKLCKGE